MQDATRLRIKATPVFFATEQALKDGYPVIVNEGGSRSSKTFSEIQLLIKIANEQDNTRISITSHSLPHIKRGALRDFRMIMGSWQLWNEDSFSKTDFIYTFPNGSYIELFGLEDPGKAHGPARDYLLINEANLISKALYDQLAMRTTKQILLDLNPSEFNSWVYKEADDPNNKKIHSSYRNNLSNLSANQIAKIERFRDLPDQFLWNVYGLGLRGASKEMIYTTWKVGKGPGKGDVFYGLDFGYVNPTALVKVELYEGVCYVEEILYRSGMTLAELAMYIKSLGIGRTPVYADAAEPKSIEEIYRHGIHILPAVKDVWSGIVTVKSQELWIYGNNIETEIQSYKWKLDKEGNPVEEPAKVADHLMDALRYAIHTHLQPRVNFFAY